MLNCNQVLKTYAMSRSAIIASFKQRYQLKTDKMIAKFSVINQLQVHCMLHHCALSIHCGISHVLFSNSIVHC